jgi:hypothetical protein
MNDSKERVRRLLLNASNDVSREYEDHGWSN